MKTTITCDDWGAVRRNTLLQFRMKSGRLLKSFNRDVAVHEKGERRWAQLPARPQIKDGMAITDAAGKVQYFPVMAFEGRGVADAFSG